MVSSFTGTCPDCRKRIYRSRRAAQAVAKQVPGKHMTAYRCAAGPGWHLGHLPRAVVHGYTSKTSYTDHVARRGGA